jgi:hypothetical protein
MESIIVHINTLELSFILQKWYFSFAVRVSIGLSGLACQLDAYSLSSRNLALETTFQFELDQVFSLLREQMQETQDQRSWS